MKTGIRKWLVALAMAGLNTAVMGQETTSTDTGRPNIILIVADDMDYTDLSLTGNKDVQTPNIDSIGKSGVQFTQAYVTCPVCGPSRVGFLTGKYQDRIGYVTNHGPKIPENFGLPTSQVLIPEMLDSAGYKSGMIGKWHLGFKPDMVPTAQGFDYFFGHLHGAHDYHPGVEKPGPIMRNTEEVKTTKYLTREFGDEAAKFIRDNKDNPYFLYVPFNAVHGPFQAPEETVKKFAHIEDEFDRTMAAMVYELDQAVGSILEAVRANGAEEDTLIVFFNDNGGVRGNMPESNGVLRAGKMTVYEGGIRVPMLMQWKGRIEPGQKYDKAVSGLDLAPTFLAAANTTTSAELDGVNLFPYISGEKTGRPHETLYWRFIDAPNQYAILKGDWKAVKPAPDAPWELYNLAKDIGETNNLANEMPAKVKELRQEWQEWNKDNAEPLFLDSRIINRRKQLEEKAIEDGKTTESKKKRKGKGKRNRAKANQ